MSMPTKGKHLSYHHHHHQQQQQSLVQQHHQHQQHQQHQQQQQQSHHNPHQQHQLVVNLNVNQAGVPQLPQGYSTVVATNTARYVSNAGSEFHVSSQNYGAQAGGQVGGGGGSVGVPGGRGPPPLAGIQSIGQSSAGIPPGGPAGAQAPPQAPAPGVQSQQSQGPAPTTTPPVHTPSPQEMGKSAHLSSYYPTPPRSQQPRSLGHRGAQGGSGTQVVGMPGVSGGGGQPTAMYPAGLTVQPGAVYVPSQVPGLHTGPQHQSVYPMNNQIIQFPGAPQRHQTQNHQSFYPSYQAHTIITPNIYPYSPGPTTQHSFFYTQPTPPLSINRQSANAVSGGGQHAGGPLGGAQGATLVPQGPLQQSAQQPQPLPQMGMLSSTDVYSGHNGGTTTTTNSSMRCRKQRGQNAITDIVDPATGKNISDEIYMMNDTATTQSSESSNRETPQPQNDGAEVVADFAARVAKAAATEESDSGSPVTANASDASASQNATQSLSNVNVQINSINDTDNQCSNTGPPTTVQNVPNIPAVCNQSLETSNNVTQFEPCAIKTDPKPLQLLAKEFHPRVEKKPVVCEEPSNAVSIVNIDHIPAQPVPLVVDTPVIHEVEVKSGVSSSNVVPQTIATPPVTIPTTNIPEVPKPQPHATAPSANPVPAREPFPSNNSSIKTSSSSPPRRKTPQSHVHNQATVAEMPSSNKDQRDNKKREKSLNSRGATPIPTHNQSDHHHQTATNGNAIGEKTEQEVVMVSRNDVQQKQSDGKSMQKQKSKSKLKTRELNRKGAEKEGTDMDAFVNTTVMAKSEIKQQDNKEAVLPKDNAKEVVAREITKDAKEKDNYELKKEDYISSVQSKSEKQTIPEVTTESSTFQTPLIEKLPIDKETLKETSSKTEDNSKAQTIPNIQTKTVPNNDVVDHAKVKEDVEIETIVAQKNEENAKISALRKSSEENCLSSTQISTEKQNKEDESNTQAGTVPKGPLSLKYTYKDDQWSPINKSGKKIYDRDFLLRLQDDPNSKIRPSNLPELDVVLKDCTLNRSTLDLRSFKDTNIMRHDGLFPPFFKTQLNPRVPNRKSLSLGTKPKVAKQNVIHVSLSLREDVKLRETENAWRPTRLKAINLSEEETKTEALYKRVRSVLNKLTPQKFNTLVDQVRALNIDTQERLQGVIDLVFEKAVDEPSFSVAYALMCKELSMMAASNEKNSEKGTSITFKKLILTRCQKEFEKNPTDEVSRTNKIKAIEESPDPEKKKDLQLALEEKERRIRIKSVGNIRFIGELFKQGMLTGRIMHRCINHLLDQTDEDSLECLCKLLTTIGKDLELKGSAEDMHDYFNKMHEIITRRAQLKISSRIRFMLQDVIDLRANKWIPRRDDSNPKTIDQIQKEAESERLDTQLNTPLNTPRKDDRNADRKKNRGGPTDEGGWSQPVGRTRPVTYSVETAKLKNKPPPMDDLQLGSRNAYLWKNPISNSKTINTNKFACLENMSTLDQDKRLPPLQLSGSRSTGPKDYGHDYKSSYDGRNSRNGSQQLSSASNRDNSLLDNSTSQNVTSNAQSIKSIPQPASVSHKLPLSEKAFEKALNTILLDYIREHMLEYAVSEIEQTFDNSSLAKFARESINFVLEKSPAERERVSRLMSQLISRKILSLQHFKTGFTDLLEVVDDLIIDIPKIWTYLAEILSHPIKDEAISLADLRSIFVSLRSQGNAGKLVGELLGKLSRENGPKWIADKWDQSKLDLNTIIDTERGSIDKIIEEYHLEFLTGDFNCAKVSTNDEYTLQQIHEQLRRLMKENTFDEVCSWLTKNVGNRLKEPKFIRTLITAILETSIVPLNESWKLDEETFSNLQWLIRRFVDTDEVSELQCLYAIQAYMSKIEFPFGILSCIMYKLWGDHIISTDAFLTWQQSKDPLEREGHAVAIVTLTAFFTSLQEADDSSSVEEGSTNVNQDCC